MRNTVEIQREGYERLVRECSDAWETLYDYRERYGWNNETVDRQLVEAVTYINALEYITGHEWFYNPGSEMVESA